MSPLESSRAWVSQAEGNVLDRLVQAGVLAPPSDFDHVLETVTNNLIIGNKLELPDPIHCRVLLTAPLESLAVGNTILLSKGLIDTLPYEEDLAAVLAFQLTHITLGHHIDTRYAFSDRMMFPDQATFQRVTLNHTTNDDAVAAKKALDLLTNSVYHDRMSNAGLFFAQLRSESKELKALTTPRLGDSLLDDSGVPIRDLPRLTGVSKEAIKMMLGYLGKSGLILTGEDPHATRVKRMDETAAARKPVLRWKGAPTSGHSLQEQ